MSKLKKQALEAGLTAKEFKKVRQRIKALAEMNPSYKNEIASGALQLAIRNAAAPGRKGS